MIRVRGPTALLGLGIACVATLLGSLSIGSDGMSLTSLAAVFGAGAESLHGDVLRQLRLPRVLTAFACGGLLAVSGALMQVLFRNPLADPYILGLAGGAGAGSIVAIAFGGGLVTAFWGGWGGALASIALLLGFGRGSFRGGAARLQADGNRLLLTGVALASGWGAAITLVLALAPDASLRGLVFWMMGDVDAAEGFALPLVALAIVLAGAGVIARDLNVLCLGGESAHALGVAVPRIRLAVVLLASAAAAAAVTTAGTIGFIGLVAPNALRWWMGNDQRWLLPSSALAGGMLLVVGDAVARSAIAPLQLPVGAVVALIGVPVFILLVSRTRAAA